MEVVGRYRSILVDRKFAAVYDRTGVFKCYALTKSAPLGVGQAEVRELSGLAASCNLVHTSICLRHMP